VAQRGSRRALSLGGKQKTCVFAARRRRVRAAVLAQNFMFHLHAHKT